MLISPVIPNLRLSTSYGRWFSNCILSEVLLPNYLLQCLRLAGHDCCKAQSMWVQWRWLSWHGYWVFFVFCFVFFPLSRAMVWAPTGGIKPFCPKESHRKHKMLKCSNAAKATTQWRGKNECGKVKVCVSNCFRIAPKRERVVRVWKHPFIGLKTQAFWCMGRAAGASWPSCGQTELSP